MCNLGYENKIFQYLYHYYMSRAINRAPGYMLHILHSVPLYTCFTYVIFASNVSILLTSHAYDLRMKNICQCTILCKILMVAYEGEKLQFDNQLDEHLMPHNLKLDQMLGN